jgi:phosphoenolpyruvate-protein kinase (PTS system EI component)
MAPTAITPAFRKAQLGETFYDCETPFTGVATGIIKVIDNEAPTPEKRSISTEDRELETANFWNAYALTVQKFEDRFALKEGQVLSEDEKEMKTAILGMVRGRATDDDILDKNSKKIPTSFRQALALMTNENCPADYAVHKALQDAYVMYQDLPGMEKTAEEFKDITRVFLEQYDPSKYQSSLKNLQPHDIPFFTDMSHGDVANLIDENGKPKVKACFVDHTTRTSHAVLKAKSEGILLAWSTDGMRPMNVEDGRRVIIDGDQKCIILGSSTQTWIDYQNKQERYEQGLEVLKKKWKGKRKVTSLDGRPFKTYINGDTPASALAVQEYGAQGMGLIRLEGHLASLAPNKRDLSVEDWYQYISDIEKNADRATFVFRLLDVEGDKAMDGFDEKKVAETDKKFITAFLEFRDNHPSIKMELMAPLILDGPQLERKQAIIDFIAETHGNKPYKLGSMAEDPKFLEELEQGNIEASFLSTGSNDMTAETLKIDRFDEEQDDQNDPTDPRVLRNIHRPMVYQRKVGGPEVLPVSICGDLASQPENFALIAGMGYRRISVAAGMVPVIKELSSRIDTGFRHRNLKHTNRKKYEALKAAAQVDDNPDNAWALLQRIVVEEDPQKRLEIRDRYNEKYLGLDSHKRIDMKWEHPNEMASDLKADGRDFEGN